MKCASCDSIIKKKDSTDVDNGFIVKPKYGLLKSKTYIVPHNDSELWEELYSDYVPKPEAWVSLCTYMLGPDEQENVKPFLTKYKRHLTFCDVCLQFINNVHEVEKNILDLYQRIDSMIKSFRSKVQVTLDNLEPDESDDEDTVKVRRFMLGIDLPKVCTASTKPTSKASTLSKSLSVLLTRLEDHNKNSGANSSRGAGKTKSKPRLQFELLANNPDNVTHTNCNTVHSKENQGLRKSTRIRKSCQRSEEYAYFGLKSNTSKTEVKCEKTKPADSSLSLQQNKTTNYDDSHEYHHAESDHEDHDVSSVLVDDSEHDQDGAECIDIDNQGDIVESDDEDQCYDTKVKTCVGEDEEECCSKPKDAERKTKRPRLMINQLEEPDLFEWKGYRFRKLKNGKLKCETCPSVLNSQPCLILHIRKIHIREGVGIFPCNTCGKSFDRAEVLKAHLPIHSEKQYQCFVCGKLYHQRPNLTHHLKTHTSEFKFHCEMSGCGKKFHSRTQLRNHTKRHLGEKPFQCEYCSRFFIDRSELNRHIRSHAEELPFKCHLCNSSFFIKYRLKRHYIRVHKIAPPSIIEPFEEMRLPSDSGLASATTLEPVPIEIYGNPGEADQADHLHPPSSTFEMLEPFPVQTSSVLAVNAVSVEIEPDFMNETVITSENSAHLLPQLNPHEELITFQSGLK